MAAFLFVDFQRVVENHCTSVIVGNAITFCSIAKNQTQHANSILHMSNDLDEFSFLLVSTRCGFDRVAIELERH